ncbi:NnrS family protein [Uliginosibacterium sp. TH139]|uniref:NnrS family protein n=1 Tax=Uliginosibacterium sp. TH139 TaxID=2067453 RepID=UPI000C7A6F84|nr:NnrS family protein [Uliginosibacterium sp. TH139]PLK50783.1 short-chain dehydrogenase [Uliginosibacterium sp. TH139]
MAVIPLTEPRRKPAAPPRGCAVFALGFRPFYLLAAILAVLFVPLWVLQLAGVGGLNPALPVLLWHGHEMVFGFACAVIVGFLFTAGKNWTGLATPTGWPLGALAGLWLAGRIALLLAPPMAAAVIDLAFLPLAGIALARVLIRAGSRRNYFALLILAALTLANALSHAGAHGWLAVSPLLGLHLAIALIATLCTVIAGRIVPSFTANALKTVPWKHAWADRIAITATVASLLAWAVSAPAAVLTPLALIAALAQAVRCWGWRPGPTLRVPLLWSLHLAHGWLIVALLLLAAGQLTAAVHVLTVGLIAGLILGMITRTALGHTGRLLKAGRLETSCYVLLQLALLARVLPALLWPAAYMPGLHLSATLWAACFALYLWKYAPMLWHPRVDGQEG